MKKFMAKIKKYAWLLCLALLITVCLTAGSVLAKYTAQIPVGSFDLSITAVEQAYAVYSADDNSLEFFYGYAPAVGTKSQTNKTATAVYSGIEEKGYSRGWSGYAAAIKKVSFIGGEENGASRKIQPKTLYNWFNGCNYVTSIDLRGLDTSNVTSMYQTFLGCHRLESLDVTGFDTSNVTSMQGMFAGCRKITELDVMNFNTAKVTNMQNMFSACYVLETLDLSSFDTTNVTSMSHMFSTDPGKSKLTSVNLSSFNTENVKSMVLMFRECCALETLDLRSFNIDAVTNMEYMFAGCESLTTILVDSGWKVGSKTTTPGMFNSCDVLEGGAGTKWADMNAALGEAACSTGTYAIIDGLDGKPGYLTGEAPQVDDSQKNYFVVYGEVFDSSNTSLGNALYFYNRELPAEDATQISLTGGYQKIEKFYDDLLGAPWTVNAPDVTMVTVADPIAPSSTASWFYKFQSCTSFNLANLDTSNATSMANMFYGCSKLNDSDLANFTIDTASAKSLNSMFYECTALTNSTENVNIFKFKNSAVEADPAAAVKLTDLRAMFAGCAKLKKVDMSGLRISGSNMNLARMFNACETITTITFTDWEISSFASGSDKRQYGTALMFGNCFKLTQLDISFIKCQSTSAQEMFSNCYDVSVIYADVKFAYNDNVSNAISMFAQCRNLVGGNGTRVADFMNESSYLNSEHARIDGHLGYGGYLTGKHDAQDPVQHASVAVQIAAGAQIEWNGKVGEDGLITGGFTSSAQHAFFANSETKRKNELQLSSTAEDGALPAAVTVMIDGEDKTSAEGVSYDSTTGVLTIPGNLLQFSGSTITIGVAS